jgi:hypothetical protein
MAEMEATMTWEGAADRSNLLPGWRVLIWCAAVVCRIAPNRANVD